MTERITIAHGSGGRQTREFIENSLVPRFGNDALAPLDDAAGIVCNGERLLFTTDSFVVKPLEFPGGDIGKLAVCGTINDLAVSGGRPLWLSCGLIMEESLETAVLERVLDSLAAEAARAGVSVVCGDTKVVERGGADGLFINTAGIGAPLDGFAPSPVRAGDAVLVSGSIGEHEAAVFQAREGVCRHLELESDCAALHELVAAMIEAAPCIHAMRDPTRGGLGAVLNELVGGTGCGILLDEAAVPVSEAVMGVCELAGFDPLYLACEGRLVCIAPADDAARLLATMRAHPLGAGAAVIGQVLDDPAERVRLRTAFGGGRIIPMPSGVQLPRIC